MQYSKKIFLSKGVHNGIRTWHYVLVDSLKLPLFKKAAASGTVDVADYGEVISSGWGEAPPDDLVKMIENQYS